MIGKFALLHNFSRRRYFDSRLYLSGCILGLLLGILFAFWAGDSVTSLMRGSIYASVSIVDLLAISLLPLLLSALTVLVSEPAFLCLIHFAKALSYGFCACAVSLAFGDAGWLVRLLLLFSDSMMFPALILFGLLSLKDSVFALKRTGWFVAYATAVAVIDYCYIYPMLLKAISR